MKSCLLFGALALPFFVLSQHKVTPRFNPDTLLNLKIDSAIVVKTSKAGLFAQDFINEMLADTSFYEAFHNMKRYSFRAENTIFTFDKKNKLTGRIYRKVKHENRGGVYKTQTTVKQDTGTVYKRNGKFQLYTVEMFDYIFMNPKNSDFVPNAPLNGESNESYKSKLKTLIFAPGRPIKGVPIVGSKTEIFSDDLKDYYDYKFYSGTYLDSIPVYRFKCTVKSELSSWTKSGLMIKELTTIFDKRNFQIMARYIDMKYSNMLFDFDVQMNIELAYFGDDLLPIKISYQGNWDIPFKREERATFLVLHTDYKKMN